MSDTYIEDNFRRKHEQAWLDESRQQAALDILWHLDEETDLGRVLATLCYRVGVTLPVSP